MKVPTFDSEILTALPPRARLAVGARAIQRCMPLYARREVDLATYCNEVKGLDHAIRLSRQYFESNTPLTAYDVTHERLSKFALLMLNVSGIDDPATSIAAACSEQCYALTQYADDHQSHQNHTVLNNTLRAGSLTKPGIEKRLYNEIASDLKKYRRFATEFSIPFLDACFPLWTSSPPDWYLTPDKAALILSFGPEELAAARAAIAQLRIQINDGLLAKIAENPEILYQIHHRKFEELIARIMETAGYEVVLTPCTRDKGRDIIAIQQKFTPIKILIECKHLKRGQRVSIDAVRALWSVRTREGASKAILATTGRFGADTMKEFENRSWELELRDYEGILEWLNILPRTPN